MVFGAIVAFTARKGENMELKPFWKQTDTVLLAISGGIDSMVLLHLFATLPTHIKPHIIVASVNHGMRQTASRDVAHVQTFCDNHHLPFYTNLTIPSHLKSEEEARTFRYNFFKQLVDEHACNYLVTAHHANDQMETILFKLIRGSSLRGISAMSFLRAWYQDCVLARPLLAYTKKDIEMYANINHISFVEDETNRKQIYTRNRIRQQIVPHLEAEHCRVGEHFLRFSQELKDTLAIVEQCVETVYPTICIHNRLNKAKLLAEIEPLQKEIVARWLHHNDVLSRRFIEQILALASASTGEKKLDLGQGKVCVISYHDIMLREDYRQNTVQPLVLSELDDGEDTSVYLTTAPTPYTIRCIEAEQMPLRLRSRLPGDVFTLKHYHKKINRIFIDEKIPAYQRDSIQLVVDAREQVVAIVHPQLIRLSKQQETGKIGPYYLNYRKRD